MCYVNINQICKNFWFASKYNTSLIDIGFRDVIFTKNIEKFSVFEERILATISNKVLYVYLINKDANNFEDAVTLIMTFSKFHIYEMATIFINGYMYTIDCNCKIICNGRK